MPKGTRKCKICGREYEYCKTNRNSGIFRYQDVACCPEHGSTYFARIMASRTGGNIVAPVENTSAMEPSEMVDDFDEYDELFEEEFDDGEEELVIETK